MPSWFATSLVIMYGPEESTVLAPPMHFPGTPAGSPRVLGPLLGRTCAAVLLCVRDPATTTALAERVGVSLASASRHATVLRNAGPVPTTRIGTTPPCCATRGRCRRPGSAPPSCTASPPLVRALLDGGPRPFSAKGCPAPGRVGPCGHAWAA
ncbi:helix-turn-helix domain-containing protein [Streptomyces sp. NBC_00841]|uniref:winged helix-turn-helix domain-containing protein n=1 Tax=unclassified Streptomyces TaxID=2593676 RepID=UPI00224FC7E6|nr:MULTISPECIES: helix-turn-helix domain-containing protein [unclassified Streptomyces]MCX4530842.1 helix-turn-helix domain-containing protein [Streptomyces sp. NBC_01669]WSA03417.1 helix-turn-helix domain-containing protein [Streptomyces sp. NBC_00841]